jgi:hypothetical protein
MAYVRLVFGLSAKLGKVPFSTIVKKSTGFDVIPINLQNSSDRMLINTLNTTNQSRNKS